MRIPDLHDRDLHPVLIQYFLMKHLDGYHWVRAWQGAWFYVERTPVFAQGKADGWEWIDIDEPDDHTLMFNEIYRLLDEGTPDYTRDVSALLNLLHKHQCRVTIDTCGRLPRAIVQNAGGRGEQDGASIADALARAALEFAMNYRNNL